jgi:hypothetical protein
MIISLVIQYRDCLIASHYTHLLFHSNEIGYSMGARKFATVLIVQCFIWIALRLTVFALISSWNTFSLHVDIPRKLVKIVFQAWNLVSRGLQRLKPTGRRRLRQ